MKNYSTLAAVLAVAAVSAPMVAQAQDPASAYKKVMELIQAGQGQDAINLCDQVIARYGKAESRMGKQFFHMVPFFLYQKADVLFRAKKYPEAYEAFKQLTDNEKFREEAYRARAKTLPGNPDGYDPLISMAQFYKGYSLFQLATGDPAKKVAGDTSKFDQAIAELEVYLKMYKTNKPFPVSKAEKKAKLDGAICFLLMQAYILKPKPDFAAADKYLAMSQNAKAPLSDEMAMSGLTSVVKVAEQNPDYIDWCYRIVNSNPGSFNLGTVRMAPYGGNMMQYGASATKIGKTFLAAGDVDKACGAFRSATMFFGLMPDSIDVLQNLGQYTRYIRSGKTVIPDKGLGIKHKPSNYKALLKNYTNYAETKQYLDSYATLQMANIGYMLGSKRIMKAGYQVVYERYPDMQMKQNVKKDDGSTASELKDMFHQNLSQLAALNRQTGDVEKAQKYEGQVDVTVLGDDSRISVVAQRMSEALTAQNWEAVVPEAQEIMKILENEKQNINYISAKMAYISANYKIAVEKLAGGDRSADLFNQVIEDCTNFLADPDKSLESPDLTPENKRNYMAQAMFFKLHSFHEQPTESAKDSAENYKKCVEASKEYIKFVEDGIKKDDLAPNVYYFCIDSLLKLQSISDNEAMAAGKEGPLDKTNAKEALTFCHKMEELWPDHKLTPVCCLISGQILIGMSYEDLHADDPIYSQISHQEKLVAEAAAGKKKKEAGDKLKALKDELQKKAEKQMDEALVLLEKAWQKALAGSEKDYKMASEALYQLYSYAPDCPREGEKAEDHQKRVQSYADAFWNDVYPHMEGCTQALKVAGTALSRAAKAIDKKNPQNSEGAFTAALAKVRDVISKEAAVCAKSGRPDAELEKTVNGYYSNYSEGYKTLGKTPSMDEKVKHFEPGTFLTGDAAGYKYITAVLKMRKVRAIQEEMQRVHADKNISSSDKASQEEKLTKAIRAEMDGYDTGYTPNDLSNHICLEVGEYFLKEARNAVADGTFSEANVDQALKYFEQIVTRRGELYEDGCLGKAKTLGLSADANKQGDSSKLFEQLLGSRNPAISSSARVGVTRLYAAKGDHANVIKTAEDYVKRIQAKAQNPESVEMHRWYGDALAATGKVDKALQIYMSIYNNNMGSISVSAPVCMRLIALYEQRNKAASGDRKDNSFKPSDMWLAWNTGNRYVQGLKQVEDKLLPNERKELRKVEEKVKELETNPTVQKEEAANKAFARSVK